VKVMSRHLDLMVEVFGEEHGCRMFRKIGPWHAKRFGPANEFNKQIVTLSSRAEFQEILARYRQWRSQFLDEEGRLKPSYRPAPLTASFMQEGRDATRGHHIAVPKGPVEKW
jgi:tRNA-dihydrouridine synthase B